MADTLTNIQTDYRFWSNVSDGTIVSGIGLRIFNTVYQGMFSPDFEIGGIKIGRLWPEGTQEDTSLTMVVGQEQYTWVTSPKFKEPIWVEGLDSNTNEPYPILWAPDMNTWSAYDRVGNSRPLYCRLINVSGTIKLALRPTPVKTDGIRITGLIEITELTQGSDSTIFLNKNSDRALSMLVAATFKAKRGESGRALELINQAKGLLPINDTTPNLTGSGAVQPWGLGHRYGSHGHHHHGRFYRR